MAMDKSALLELLEALKAADVDDRVRMATQHLYQALIDAEANVVIGADRWERSDARAGIRGRGSGVADPETQVWFVLPRRCWNVAGGSIRRCSRWSWRRICTG